MIMVVIKYIFLASQGGVYLHSNTDSGKRQAAELLDMAAKRRANERVSDWLRPHVSDAAITNFDHCGDYLVFLEDAAREHRKLDVGFFCKQRLCAGCAWRASLASAQCIGAIAGKLCADGRQMIMVTLTVPNVRACDLRATIQHINRSWSRLLKRQRYAVWADYVRKLEITYNKSADTYHPHLHCVVFAPKSYFGKRYISHAQLLHDWQQVTKQPEITQVDVRRCREYRAGTNAILEVAKYAAKSGDYAQTKDTFDTFYAALHHTRIMEYGGICKTLRDEYKLGHLDKYAETDTVKYTLRVVYLWSRMANAYDEHDVQEYDMDAAELAKLQADEDKLAAYAIDKANRTDNVLTWLRTSWVRELRDADEWEVLND